MGTIIYVRMVRGIQKKVLYKLLTTKFQHDHTKMNLNNLNVTYNGDIEGENRDVKNDHY